MTAKHGSEWASIRTNSTPAPPSPAAALPQQEGAALVVSTDLAVWSRQCIHLSLRQLLPSSVQRWCVCPCRALGIFVLWVFIIHLACFLVHKLRKKSSSVLQLGLNCLLLTTNNTGLIGWPVLVATVGPQNAVLSMLLGEKGGLLLCPHVVRGP